MNATDYESYQQDLNNYFIIKKLIDLLSLIHETSILTNHSKGSTYYDGQMSLKISEIYSELYKKLTEYEQNLNIAPYDPDDE